MFKPFVVYNYIINNKFCEDDIEDQIKLLTDLKNRVYCKWDYSILTKLKEFNNDELNERIHIEIDILKINFKKAIKLLKKQNIYEHKYYMYYKKYEDTKLYVFNDLLSCVKSTEYKTIYDINDDIFLKILKKEPWKPYYANHIKLNKVFPSYNIDDKEIWKKLCNINIDTLDSVIEFHKKTKIYHRKFIEYLDKYYENSDMALDYVRGYIR